MHKQALSMGIADQCTGGGKHSILAVDCAIGI